MVIVVVGAGVAGLVAARAASAEHDVTVLDKARGVGGRLATRRIGEATFDHGAQFFTTHSAEFAAMVEDWSGAGVARPWFSGRVGAAGVEDPDGHTRYRGVDTMNAVAKHLAVGLDVRSSSRIVALTTSGARWSVLLEDGSTMSADAVVATCPVPQSLELLDAGGTRVSDADRRSLEAIRYDPCLAVLAPLTGPSGLADPGAVDPARGPIDWIADNQIKGVSHDPAVTIHATANYSRERWDSEDSQVVAELVDAAALASSIVPGAAQVQRWRYARPAVLHPERCLVAVGTAPLVVAGDAFGTAAKVEGAALSGAAAGAALIDLLR